MERLTNTLLETQFCSLKCPNDINHNTVKTELHTNIGNSQKMFSNIITDESNVTVKLEPEQEGPKHLLNCFQEIPNGISASFQIKQEVDEDADDLFVEDFEQNYFHGNQDNIKLEYEERSEKIKTEVHKDEGGSVVNFNVDEQYFNNNSIMAKLDEANIHIKPEIIEDEVDVMEFKVEEDCLGTYPVQFEDKLSDIKSESENSNYDFDSEVDVTGSDYDNDSVMEGKTVQLKSLKHQQHSNLSGFKKNKQGINNNNNNEKEKHRCTYCTYETSSTSYLQIHIALHEDPSQFVWHYCTQCNYKTRQKSHLKRHEYVHLDPESANLFICDICSSGFKQKCSLKRHIQFVHNDTPASQSSKVSETKFQCDSCDYSTFKKDLLVAHLDKHKEKDSYICGICHFSTKYRRNLRMHLETHVESEALKVFECKWCKYSTRLRRCLKRHLTSKKHLATVGRLSDYRPRGIKD